MDRRYIIAGLFFVAAAIMAVVLVYPKYQVVRISSQLAAEKQSEFDAQLVLVQEISRLRSQQRQMTEEIAQVADLLPVFSKKSVADLFVELEVIAAESGLLMDTVSFAEIKATAPRGQEKAVVATTYKTISAQVKMKGEYRDFKKFVRTIETNKHLMDITITTIASSAIGSKVKVQDEEKDTAVPEVPPTYTVTINAYYQ